MVGQRRTEGEPGPARSGQPSLPLLCMWEWGSRGVVSPAGRAAQIRASWQAARVASSSSSASRAKSRLFRVGQRVGFLRAVPPPLFPLLSFPFLSSSLPSRFLSLSLFPPFLPFPGSRSRSHSRPDPLSHGCVRAAHGGRSSHEPPTNPHNSPQKSHGATAAPVASANQTTHHPF